MNASSVSFDEAEDAEIAGDDESGGKNESGHCEEGVVAGVLSQDGACQGLWLIADSSPNSNQGWE